MKTMTAKEVELAIAEGTQLNILDVHEAAGKIPGAVNIPLGLLEFRMNELDKSKEYIMVCLSGGRSGSASQFLESHGYHVINMAGGMYNWEGNVE